MHAKFEGGNLKIERAVSILVKWVSIMWSNLNFAHLVDLVHIRAAINSCKKFFLVCLIELLNNEYFLSKLNKKAIRWPQKWFQNYVIKLKHLLYGSHLPNTITIIFY